MQLTLDSSSAAAAAAASGLPGGKAFFCSSCNSHTDFPSISRGLLHLLALRLLCSGSDDLTNPAGKALRAADGRHQHPSATPPSDTAAVQQEV